MARNNNLELSDKLCDEMKKHDMLMDEKMDVQKKLELAKSDLDEHSAIVKEQDDAIARLKAEIEAKTAVVDDMTAKIENEKKLFQVEDERKRKLSQMATALKTKLEFMT